jgi:hypothetical protein
MSKGFKICYAVTEYKGKVNYQRIGMAFINDDDTEDVKLDAFPVNGRMVIRAPIQKGEVLTSRYQGGAGGGGGGGGGASRAPSSRSGPGPEFERVETPAGRMPIDEDDIPF